VLLKPLGHPSWLVNPRASAPPAVATRSACRKRARSPAPSIPNGLFRRFSGEGGIRTHGRFRRHGLANRSLGPLGHLSSHWGGRIRTCDPRINSPVLCQLSYAPSTSRKRARPTGRLLQAAGTPLLRSAGCVLQLPRQGSNLDFPDPESGVLPITPRGKKSSGRRGSNPRPSAWEADALPTELLPRNPLRTPPGPARKDNRIPARGPEPPVGFEPTTARLRIECSTPELRWRLMEPRGIEPLTSAVRLQRSPI
jgi:hypothetical protein